MLLACFMASCACDRDKVAPCAGKKATSAEFNIYEATGNGFHEWGLIDTDSIVYTPICDGCTPLDSTYKIAYLNEVNLKFKALDTTAKKYEWRFNDSDQVFTTSGFSLRFIPKKVLASSIAITLILSKTPNKECFPQDNGIDTLTKTLHFVKMKEQDRHRLEGNY